MPDSVVTEPIDLALSVPATALELGGPLAWVFALTSLVFLALFIWQLVQNRSAAISQAEANQAIAVAMASMNELLRTIQTGQMIGKGPQQ